MFDINEAVRELVKPVDHTSKNAAGNFEKGWESGVGSPHSKDQAGQEEEAAAPDTTVDAVQGHVEAAEDAVD
jgi:hypothetical protein